MPCGARTPWVCQLPAHLRRILSSFSSGTFQENVVLILLHLLVWIMHLHMTLRSRTASIPFLLVLLVLSFAEGIAQCFFLSTLQTCSKIGLPMLLGLFITRVIISAEFLGFFVSRIGKPVSYLFDDTISFSNSSLCH